MSVEQHIVIDSKRNITVPEELQKIAVQYDHNVETVTFDCPKMWDDVDLSASDKKIRINYMRSDGAIGTDLATDVTVEGDIMHFNWTVKKHATMVNGPLTFLVCVTKVDTDGNEVNHWNSELNNELYVSEGLEVDQQTIASQYPDIVEYILSRVVTDGLCPTVTVTKIASGHRLTVTSPNNTDTFDILDGVDGVDGKDGKDGKAASITIGTVTTGAPGTEVEVTNTGTAKDAILNFKIPQGDVYVSNSEIALEDGCVSLTGDDRFKRYIIYSDPQTVAGYTDAFEASVRFVTEGGALMLAFADLRFAEYRKYFEFEYLGVVSIVGGVRVHYILNGVESNVDVSNFTLSDFKKCFLQINDATKVITSATGDTITGLKGDKGDKGDPGEPKELGEVEGTAYEGHKGAQNARDIKTLYAMAEQRAAQPVLPISDSYTTRKTANGADIIDGQYTKVTKITGKTVKSENVLPIVTRLGESNGVTYSVDENGVVTLNGTPTDTVVVTLYSNRTTQDILTNGKTYTVKLWSNATFLTSYVYLNTNVSEDGFAWTSNNLFSTLGKDSVTFTVNKDYPGFQVFVVITASAGQLSNLKLYPTLVEGSEVKSWKPYFANLKHAYFKGIKSTGKNLFNPLGENTMEGVANWTFEKDRITKAAVSGNATDYVTYSKVYPAGTYTFFGDIEATGSSTDHDTKIRLVFHTLGTVTGVAKYNTYYQGYYVDIVGGVAFIFTASEDFSISLVFAGTSNSTKTYKNIQLEFGGEATEYEPYTEDMSFSYSEAESLAQWDYLLPQEGKRVRQSSGYTFDGSETWTVNSEMEKWFVIESHALPTPASANANSPNMMTSTRYDTKYEAVDGTIYISTYEGSDSRVVVNDSTYPTLDEWKAHLAKLYAAGTPLQIAYKTATPTEDDVSREYTTYLVNARGSETVDQGDTDNSTYGAIPTVENEYLSSAENWREELLVTKRSTNLLDMSKVSTGYILNVKGDLTSATNYTTTDFIPCSAGDTIRHQFDYNGIRYDNTEKPGYTLIIYVCAYDSDKGFISGSNVSDVRYYECPENTAFVRLSFSKSYLAGANAGFSNIAVVVSDTVTPLPYEEYKVSEVINGEYMNDEFIEEIVNKKCGVIDAYLPKNIYCAVGRTIELYNNQVCLQADKYHLKWTCTIGKALSRKFSVTGTESLIGTYPLSLDIYDDNRDLVWSGSTTLNIVSGTLTNSYSVCPIGDSLSNGKPWLAEVVNLSSEKISYVGTYSAQVQDADGTWREIHHEGRSGWSAGAYLRETAYTYGGESDPHPFWNGSKFSLYYYVQNSAVSPSAVQIFLGTNGLISDNTYNAQDIKQIVDNIRAEYTNKPIFVVNTIYRGTQDGIGVQQSNDGYVSQKGVYKYDEDKKVMDLMKRLDALLDGYDGVYMINLALMHDSEYNFGAVETPVNPRAAQTEFMPVESVHPQKQGYYQMADVIYSVYCAALE